MPPAAITGNRAHGVDDRGHERERGRRAADVPTGLAALGDDHVDARLGSRDGLGDRADGVEVERPGIVDHVDVGAGVTPERGDERDSVAGAYLHPFAGIPVEHEVDRERAGRSAPGCGGSSPRMRPVPST